MIARLASGLKQLPSAVRGMTLPQAYDLFEYWQEAPPEQEMLALLAEVFTSWEATRPPVSEVEARIEHQKSLDRRWRAGAMNVAQMYGAMGGRGGTLDGGSGTFTRVEGPGPDMGGIGPFPGHTVH